MTCTDSPLSEDCLHQRVQPLCTVSGCVGGSVYARNTVWAGFVIFSCPNSWKDNVPFLLFKSVHTTFSQVKVWILFKSKFLLYCPKKKVSICIVKAFFLLHCPKTRWQFYCEKFLSCCSDSKKQRLHSQSILFFSKVCNKTKKWIPVFIHYWKFDFWGTKTLISHFEHLPACVRKVLLLTSSKHEIMDNMFQESRSYVIFHVKDEVLDTRITNYYSTRESRRRLLI